MAIGLGTLLLLLFAGALVPTLVVPRRWRWIGALGAAAAVVFWVAQVASGCAEDFEVACGLQPLVFGFFALMMLASWVAGVGAALLLRRLADRNADRS